MRKVIVLSAALALVCLSIASYSQINMNAQWTWVNGEKHLPMRPVMGTKGISSSANSPGGRKQSVSWKDQHGMIWIFGGFGYGGHGLGYLNDLWKYDPATNQWTWINGDNSINVAGVYGTQGVASGENKPGSRSGSVSWMDNNGIFYLFGGLGNGGRLNDLWKYDPQTNQWAWLGGSATANATGVYGSQQVAGANNWPGARNGATGWKDNNNNIWLFGGDGYGAIASLGRLNDLWKYDPQTNQWTWMSGSDAINTATISVGPTGVPGGRSGSMGWEDNAGNLYLFGGNSYTTVPASPDYTPFWAHTLNNQLWRFSTITNQWFQLTMGAAVTRPVAREYGLSWSDDEGNLWLFGGHGSEDGGSERNDLWKFDIGSAQWTKIKEGINDYQDYGLYGVKGIADAANRQPARSSNTGWVDDEGKLWSFGGDFYEGVNGTYRNDVWVYDPSTNMQTWINGDTAGFVNPMTGIDPDPINRPGERVGGATWADNSGNLWLFGGDVTLFGDGPVFRILGDFWKYDITAGQWNTLPNTGSRPGARDQAATWVDAQSNLWLFGGGNGNLGSYNDVWKYNASSNEWTILNGTNGANNSQGSYGVMGVSNPSNLPPAKKPSASWVDNAGNFWCFGGDGGTGSNMRNDLWKYNPVSNQWTWMNGDNITNQAGVYGTIAIPSINNKPGARGRSASWKDNAGNLWMLGGSFSTLGGTSYFGDLWKYDVTVNQWTWVKGDNTVNGAGIYGTKGTASSTNKPGARFRPAYWTDANGNFWLFGGRGFDANGSFGELNDLWVYDPLTNEWTWVKGDNVINVGGEYGTKAIGNASNKPGSRGGAMFWKDAADNFWLYGGYGYAEAGSYRLSDLWRLSPAAASPLAVHLLEFKGRLINDNGVLNWKTENEENADKFIIERSIDRRTYSAVGTVAARNIVGMHQYSFTDNNIAALNTTVVYYRLKQVDFDGKATYSGIIALTLDKSFIVLFYPNPVIKTANVTITIDRPQTISVRVISQSGAIVKQLQWKLTDQSTSYPIDMNSLPPGSYWLDIAGDAISKRISFVKQ